MIIIYILFSIIFEEVSIHTYFIEFITFFAEIRYKHRLQTNVYPL
jgi:hypothetical protein